MVSRKRVGRKTEPDNHSPLVLCPYFLEHQRLQLDAGYQGEIPNTAEFDLVICILWSRLGTLLAPTLRMPDGSAPAREQNTKLAGRWTTQARTGACRRCAFIATVRSRRRRWNRKRSAKPFSGNGTPSRSSLRVGRRTARGTSPGFSTSIATCRSLKSSSGGISAIFYWVR